MSSAELTGKQAHALLDVLSHDEVYAEILDFRSPGVLDNYGPPFEAKPGTSSRTPSLQALVSRFLLHLPGLRDINTAFWNERIASLISGFEHAELSESYDKGHIGIRKTLATAISALIEYPVRGVFAGFDEPSQEDVNRQYDVSKAGDLSQAFRDFMHQIVYGNIVDDLVKKVSETDKLSDHSKLVQAFHEYVLVNLASFMHYTLIISPKGQNLLTLIDQANKMVPYAVMKQTLRIGNVASMINAMVKVGLAKMSMGSVTNWIGWTSGADEGMNLIQHIISQVLQWDIRDLRNRASKVEKEKRAPEKEQLDALKAYLTKTRAEHENLRDESRTHAKPIVSTILQNSSASSDLTEEQHKFAQDYLSVQLAIRDREQIIKVMCHSTPDQLTQSVRDIVEAYDPLIRQTHNAVDLGTALSDFDVFLKDLIKLAKVSETRGRHLHKSPEPPTVGDFLQLLKKHQQSSHRFLHQVCKNGPEITSWFRDYTLQAASNFRRTSTTGSNPPSTSTGDANAGDLTSALNEIFSKLDESKQTQFKKLLDKHAKYLAALHAASARRLQSVISSPPSNHPIFKNHGMLAGSSSQPGSRSSSPGHQPVSSTQGLEANPGPGAFLARWQALIDNSEITPLYSDNEVRHGGSGSVLKASRVGPDSGMNTDEAADGRQQKDNVPSLEDEDSGDEDVFEEAHEQMDQFGLNEKEKTKPPDMRGVVADLSPGFKEVLKKRGCDW